MRIESSSFANNGDIPLKFTCQGDNISTDLKFSDVSDKALSLVLIMDDPDAPNGTFTHWLVWNINPTKEMLQENDPMDDAIQGINDFNTNQYGGPCPPSGKHRYVFRLYALNDVLELPESSGRRELERAMTDKIIDMCELVGMYSKNSSDLTTMNVSSYSSSNNNAPSSQESYGFWIHDQLINSDNAYHHALSGDPEAMELNSAALI